MTKQLRSTEVRKGEMVTTVNNLGGIGIGYLVDGQVWRTTGSYWACLAEQDVFGLASYSRDGGEGYRVTVRRITGYSDA